MTSFYTGFNKETRERERERERRVCVCVVWDISTLKSARLKWQGDSWANCLEKLACWHCLGLRMLSSLLLCYLQVKRVSHKVQRWQGCLDTCVPKGRAVHRFLRELPTTPVDTQSCWCWAQLCRGPVVLTVPLGRLHPNRSLKIAGGGSS